MSETMEKQELTAVAHLNNYRLSDRKVKIVADHLRGKSVEEARDILEFTSKAAAKPLLKLLNSAVANAVNNNNMKEDKLYVAEIYATQGPTLKRIRPAAKGSANRINKRTSHTTIVLKERD